MKRNQTTIAGRISLDGVGVHSGLPTSLVIHPACADTGIVFQLTGADGIVRDVAAVSNNLSATDLSTVIGDGAGALVATVEHLMAALYGFDIDNAVVEIEGGEVPIMDGSAFRFIEAIEDIGIVEQRARRRFIKVLKPVRVEMQGGFGVYEPYDGTRFEVEIDFANAAIGRQSFAGDLTPAMFRDELSRARTFGFMKDVERLWASGHALGSSLDNSVVIGDDERVINPGGLRFVDEFVRHKALDAVGDQALAGARILGCYKSYRGGHRLNGMALKALLADSSAYELVEVGSRPSRGGAHAPLVAVAASAFGPQTA